MWIGVGFPCPPVRNDIVTPRYLFFFYRLSIPRFTFRMNKHRIRIKLSVFNPYDRNSQITIQARGENEDMELNASVRLNSKPRVNCQVRRVASYIFLCWFLNLRCNFIVWEENYFFSSTAQFHFFFCGKVKESSLGSVSFICQPSSRFTLTSFVHSCGSVHL